ncbi:MAG: endonuclease/exonuclease/phosphatase family protein [Cocleimonas sp.]
MNLVTWNLNGLEDENLDVRTEAAMFHTLLGVPIEKAAVTPNFKPNTPDIVVLQEVVERTFHAHIKPHLKAAGFTLFPPEPTERSYFEVIAVREPILESSYEKFSYSDQGRGLSTLSINGLTILTAHLESLKPGASMRIDQAESILKIMNEHTGAIIFAGDTNLRKSEWEDLKPDNVNDAWEATGALKKHKITWQMEKYQARYDRVWLKGVDIKTFETFGKGKVTGTRQRPSDHLGIKIDFELI